MIKYVIIFIILILSSSAFGYSQHDNVTYYFLSSENPIVAWDASEGYNVKYDLYLKRFEWDEIVQKNTNIVGTQKEITFPKSGLYIIQLRARAELTTSQIDALALLTKEALVLKATEWNILSDINISLTADQIRVKIIELGMASMWIESIDSTYAVVDSEPRSWWVYTYIDSPGPIIINPGP